jgi:hypothetical protein
LFYLLQGVFFGATVTGWDTQAYAYNLSDYAARRRKASNREHETFRARYARQGIHIHRIDAENINKSP